MSEDVLRACAVRVARPLATESIFRHTPPTHLGREIRVVLARNQVQALQPVQRAVLKVECQLRTFMMRPPYAFSTWTRLVCCGLPFASGDG